MQAGISTACFYPTATEKTLETIRSVGCSVIEVFTNALEECGHVFINDLKTKCLSLGLDVYSFHSPVAFAEPYLFFSGYKRREDEGYELYKKMFTSAAMLGAKVFNFHGDSAKYSRPIEQSCEVYYKLRQLAKKEGIIFSQENVWYCTMGDPKAVLFIKEYLKGDVSFTLDVKQANRKGISPFEMLECMGDKTVNIHINDFDDKYDCLLPGAGTFDVKSFIEKTADYGYKGPYIIEVYGSNFKNLSELEKSFDFLNKI